MALKIHINLEEYFLLYNVLKDSYNTKKFQD